MGRYFSLQGKRFLRLLPWAFLAAALLIAAIGAVYTLTVQQRDNPDNDQKITVALCGNIENSLLELGLTALETFDSSRFSIRFLQLSQQDAARALDAGELAAYVVIPDEFVQEAFRGNILPLQMVTAADAPGIVSIFREEVAQTVTKLLLDAQRGVFGMARCFADFPAEGQQALVNDLALEYAQLAFSRNAFYTAGTLDTPGLPSLAQNFVGGLSVLFLLLVCLPFAPLLIRQNTAVQQMLRSKGHSALSLAISDYSVFLLSFVCLLAGLLLVPVLAFPEAADMFCHGILPLLTVIVTVAAFCFFLGSLCSDLISGMLLQFFTTVAMCFFCGCMYPISFFPEKLQRLAAVLPAGLARSVLTDWLCGSADAKSLLWLWLYSAAFVASGCMIRSRLPGRIRR